VLSVPGRRRLDSGFVKFIIEIQYFFIVFQ